MKKLTQKFDLYPYIITYFAFLYFFTGCSSKAVMRDDAGVTYDIYQHQVIDTKVNSRDIYDELTYISLQTSDDVLIGEVNQLEVSENAILILSENQVFGFEMSGEVKFVINRFGKGPGEYLRIDNMSIDADILRLYDNTLSRLISFDANIGAYIETKKVPFSVKRIYVKDSVFFADKSLITNKFVNKEERVVTGIFDNFSDVKGYHVSDNKEVNPLATYEMTVSQNTIYWQDRLFNTIYQVEKDALKPYAKYDFGEQNAPESMSKKWSLTQLSQQGKIFNINNFFENSNFMVANIMYGENSVWMKYDKQTNINYIYTDIENDHYYVSPLVNAAKEDKFYRVVPPWEVILIKKTAMESSDFRLSPYHDLFNKRDANDNPLIAVFTLN